MEGITYTKEPGREAIRVIKSSPIKRQSSEVTLNVLIDQRRRGAEEDEKEYTEKLSY